MSTKSPEKKDHAKMKHSNYDYPYDRNWDHSHRYGYGGYGYASSGPYYGSSYYAGG